MRSKNLPLVSVIIPVYNADRYIERCIESVLAQQYSNIEIVLVDDGSTDKSGVICDKYVAEHPEVIRVLHQQNSGASIARKAGIREANGELLAFVDSDDYVSERYISSLYEAMTAHSTDVSVCSFKIVENSVSVDSGEATQITCLTQDELFKRFFKYEFWGFGGGLYLKSLFDRVLFPTATVNEDYYVKAQIFSECLRVAYVDADLYFYEKHPDSLSSLKISLRALGEFDNAQATWLFFKASAPRFSSQSLAIASEAAVKWLGQINRTPSQEFQSYRQRIRKFVRQNFFRIMVCRTLLWKIKVVLILCYLRSFKSN